jgi:hypothetical protein
MSYANRAVATAVCTGCAWYQPERVGEFVWRVEDVSVSVISTAFGTCNNKSKLFYSPGTGPRF